MSELETAENAAVMPYTVNLTVLLEEFSELQNLLSFAGSRGLVVQFRAEKPALRGY